MVTSRVAVLGAACMVGPTRTILNVWSCILTNCIIRLGPLLPCPTLQSVPGLTAATLMFLAKEVYLWSEVSGCTCGQR